MHHRLTTPHPVPVRHYAQQFSSTRRGARLARLMGAQQLADWGLPYDTDAGRTAALLIGELTANAALHAPPPGPRQGRDFQLRLVLREHGAALRIEVSDAYGDRALPVPPLHPNPEAETGRGLLLIATLANRWGVTALLPVGKTVWCELG